VGRRRRAFLTGAKEGPKTEGRCSSVDSALKHGGNLLEDEKSYY